MQKLDVVYYYKEMLLEFFLDEDKSLGATPRLFHMSSVHCKFEVAEIISDQLKMDIPCPLLFTQECIYIICLK